MSPTQIAAQMYTLREHCKTPADIAKTCKKLADIGFAAVQPSAVGPIETAELKKILDDNGLACAATHSSLDEMKDPGAIVARHQELGCELTALGGFGFGGESTREQWSAFAQEFSSVGKTLAEKGLRVGYHNHSHELAPFVADPAKIDPRDTPMRMLLQKLDPSVWVEVDTYWIVHGGGDPAAWIDEVAASGPGRLPAVHFKDLTVTFKREQKMCEVGAGNLNWPAILEACRRAGVRWYIIERDHGDLDPFESLRISRENMLGMGLS